MKKETMNLVYLMNMLPKKVRQILYDKLKSDMNDAGAILLPQSYQTAF